MLRKRFGKLDTKIKLIKKEEERINKTIRTNINNFINSVEKNKDKLSNPLNTFNPLTSHLYFKMSYTYFRTFLSKKLKLKLDIYEKESKNKSFFVSRDEDNNSDLAEINNQLLENKLEHEYRHQMADHGAETEDLDKLKLKACNNDNSGQPQQENEPVDVVNSENHLMSRTISKVQSEMYRSNHSINDGESNGDRLIIKENQF